MVAGMELHAGPRLHGQDLGELDSYTRVCHQSSVTGSGNPRGPPGAHHRQESRAREMRVSFGKNVSAVAVEVHIVRLHVDEALLMGDASRPYIDPEKWRPLIMSFCRFSESASRYTRPAWRNRVS